MNTTLLIMAAGIGSRFGTGIKQLEPVDDANHAIDKFAEAFGLCEDQEAEREKDLQTLIDAVCEQEPGIPKCTVDRVIRTAFDLLEEDEEEEDEDDE